MHIELADDVPTFGALCDLVEAVWDERLVIPEMLRAITHAGGYVAGAWDDTGALIGASVAFLGRHGDEVHLHSHITGVTPTAQSHGVGFLLKHHQREWCLDRDIHAIEWTYDPSVARNAWFNLQRLGADVECFVPDFYGSGDDRFVVRWSLDEAGSRDEPVAGDGDVCVPIDGDLRAGLQAAIADGCAVVGVTRSGTYVLRRR
ncbi:MAG TPA: GNAT family N-acetyltransferase [Acidimicrobiales bacterium]|nr:GNAT family N-acetyltransferase [Acidimicrobiales bacterium]